MAYQSKSFQDKYVNDPQPGAPGGIPLGGEAKYLGGGKYSADGKTFDSYGQLIDYQQQRTRVGDRARQFQTELTAWDTEANRFKDQTLRSFQNSTDYQGARAAAGIAASAGQFAQRRGLGDQFTAALTAEQQGQMRQNLTQSNLDFESKLNQLMNSERMGFVSGEFDFFHKLQAADYAQALSKDMARFQADLANDYSFQQAFGDLLQVGGTVLGLNLFGGGQQQQSPYNSATQYRYGQAGQALAGLY